MVKPARRTVAMDKVIEVNVDSGTLFAAEERLSGLGLSVQEAVLRLMENAAKGQAVGCDTGAGTEITEKTMSLSEARQKPGEVSAFIGEPGAGRFFTPELSPIEGLRCVRC